LSIGLRVGGRGGSHGVTRERIANKKKNGRSFWGLRRYLSLMQARKSQADEKKGLSISSEKKGAISAHRRFTSGITAGPARKRWAGTVSQGLRGREQFGRSLGKRSDLPSEKL